AGGLGGRAAPSQAGSAWVRSVSRVTTRKVPPPPPLSAQNRSGFWAALAVRTAPSAVTTSASSRFAAAVPKPFEKAPKPPPCTRPATPTVGQPPPCTYRPPVGVTASQTAIQIPPAPPPPAASGPARPAAPRGTNRSCSCTARMLGLVQMSSESGAFDPPT